VIKIYGIPNCGSVKKALNFFNEKGAEYEFVDFKKQKPSTLSVESWSKAVGMDKLFNTKGTKYKSSGLDYAGMSHEERVNALANEPTMIKRPVVDRDGTITVGFDEALFEKAFI